MISHKLKVIFIHVPRTGGTSIEMALIGKDWWDVDPDTKHIDWVKAKEVYARYWDDYFKFSVARNPWDWLASLYNSHRRGGDKSWSEFIASPNLRDHEQESIIQSDIIGNEVDMVLRFEHLQDDFSYLCKKIGVEARLPHVEIGQGERTHYSEYYTDEQRFLIERMFGKDIDRFNYSFSSPAIEASQQNKQIISSLKGDVVELNLQLKKAEDELARLKKLLQAVRGDLTVFYRSMNWKLYQLVQGFCGFFRADTDGRKKVKAALRLLNDEFKK